MSYFMGIDLGTSSTKTLIMDENGKTAGIGNASYGIQIPQISYAERDPWPGHSRDRFFWTDAWNGGTG